RRQHVDLGLSPARLVENARRPKPAHAKTRDRNVADTILVARLSTRPAVASLPGRPVAGRSGVGAKPVAPDGRPIERVYGGHLLDARPPAPGGCGSKSSAVARRSTRRGRKSHPRPAP